MATKMLVVQLMVMVLGIAGAVGEKEMCYSICIPEDRAIGHCPIEGNMTMLDAHGKASFSSVSNVLNIRENILPREPVYVARTLDTDNGLGGSTTYRLTNDLDGLFTMDEMTGEIFLHSPLDYERRATYRLLLVAESQSPNENLIATMVLTVNVKDANDNTPRFTKEVYDFNVSENAAISSMVGKVSAVDADSSHNGLVSYFLEPSPYLSLFDISAAQGVLSVRDKLDNKNQDVYVLTVVAMDHGTPRPLSATATIRIHLSDTNDNPLMVTPARYKFTVLENQASGSHVGQVTFYGREAGDNNQRLQFQFSHPQPNFAINTYSGEIITSAPLDREEQQHYVLTVNITEPGAQTHRYVAVVEVNVLDVNDNDPVFAISNKHRETVLENRSKGLRVMKVMATDSDAGENGTVSFYIEPSKLAFLFPST